MDRNVFIGMAIGLAVLIALNLRSTFRRYGTRRMWRDFSAGVLFFLVYPIAALFIGAATNMIIALALIVVWTLPLNYIRQNGFDGLGFNARTAKSFLIDALLLILMLPVAILLNHLYDALIESIRSASPK